MTAADRKRRQRAQKRKRTAVARLLRPGEHDDGQFDAKFWASLTPEERLSAVWQATLDWAALNGIPADELRLRRSVVGIRRG